MSIHSILHSNDDHFTENFPISKDKPDKLPQEKVETIILASGNLGLIYFTNWTERVTIEMIEKEFPDLIKNLVKHDGIGFVMLKSEIHGTVVCTSDNTYYLYRDNVDDEKFREVYGENIFKHLRRTDGFDHVPDILVNSTYDVDNDEVYAFEELIGSHGGVGGTQQEPFILHPALWTIDEKIVGAENVNKLFKAEIKKSMRKD